MALFWFAEISCRTAWQCAALQIQGRGDTVDTASGASNTLLQRGGLLDAAQRTLWRVGQHLAHDVLDLRHQLLRRDGDAAPLRTLGQ